MKIFLFALGVLTCVVIGIATLIWVFIRSDVSDQTATTSKLPIRFGSFQEYYKSVSEEHLKDSKPEYLRLKSKSNRCVCVERPPPLPHHVIKQRNLYEARYMCERNNANFTSAIANCTEECKWEITVLLKCDDISPESTGCSDDPPLLSPSIRREWNGSKFVGASSRYFCINDKVSVVETAVCLKNGTWKLSNGSGLDDAAQYCVCKMPPPCPMNENVVVHWNKSNIHGSIVKYSCLLDTEFGTIQLAICSSNSEWILENNLTWNELIRLKCECKENLTQPNYPTVYDWSTNIRHMGTVIKYWCDGTRSTIHKLMRCSVRKKWEMEFYQSCECQDEVPLYKTPVRMVWSNDSRYIGTHVNYYCTQDSDSILFLTLFCDLDRSWKETFTNSCECSNDPVDALNPATSDWDKVSRYIGLVIIHYCTSDPVYGIQRVIRCTSSGIWITTFSYLCECLGEPLDVDSAGALSWNGRSKLYVNSSVFYHCSNDFTSPIYQTATCNQRRQWEYKYSNSISELRTQYCNCRSHPPDAEQFGLEWTWNEKNRAFGTKINYFHVSNGLIVFSVICKYDGTWRLSAEKSSKELFTGHLGGVCPDFPKNESVKRTWNHRRNRIGSLVFICCPSNQSKISEMYICSKNKTWSLIQKENCNFLSTSNSTEFSRIERQSTTPNLHQLFINVTTFSKDSNATSAIMLSKDGNGTNSRKSVNINSSAITTKNFLDENENTTVVFQPPDYHVRAEALRFADRRFMFGTTSKRSKNTLSSIGNLKTGKFDIESTALNQTSTIGFAVVNKSEELKMTTNRNNPSIVISLPITVHTDEFPKDAKPINISTTEFDGSQKSETENYGDKTVKNLVSTEDQKKEKKFIFQFQISDTRSGENTSTKSAFSIVNRSSLPLGISKFFAVKINSETEHFNIEKNKSAVLTRKLTSPSHVLEDNFKNNTDNFTDLSTTFTAQNASGSLGSSSSNNYSAWVFQVENDEPVGLRYNVDNNEWLPSISINSHTTSLPRTENSIMARENENAFLDNPVTTRIHKSPRRITSTSNQPFQLEENLNQTSRVEQLSSLAVRVEHYSRLLLIVVYTIYIFVNFVNESE